MSGPTIAISNAGGVTHDLSETISGTVDGVAAGTSVYLYDNGAETPAGVGTVAADGTWSADVLLSAEDNRIAARTPWSGDLLTSNTIDFVFEPVLSPPSNGQTSGSSSPTLVRIAPIASHTAVQADADSEVFVFDAHPGHTVLTGFDVSGPSHDRIQLPAAAFQSIADLLHHIHGVGHGSVLTMDHGNDIAFIGVTAHALKAHPGDFRL